MSRQSRNLKRRLEEETNSDTEEASPLSPSLNPSHQLMQRNISLVSAIRNANETVVQCLLDAKADPNFDSSDSAPILLAAEKGNLYIINALLVNKADVNRTNMGTNRTALWTAIKNAQYEIADLLLQARANPNINWQEQTPLAIAIDKGAPFKLIVKLIRNRADINAPIIERSFDGEARPIRLKFSLLEHAVQAGRAEIVCALLEAKAPIPDLMRSFPEPAETMRMGRERALQVIAWARSPEDRRRIKSNLLRYYVKEHKDIPVLEWLLARKADPKTVVTHKAHLIPLIAIAEFHKNATAIQRLLDAKAEPHAKAVPLASKDVKAIKAQKISPPIDNSPRAFFAALRDAPQTVKNLVASKADVNAAYKRWTPLIAAISFRVPDEVLITLLDAKADTNCLHPERSIKAYDYAKKKQYSEETLAAIAAATAAHPGTSTSAQNPARLLANHAMVTQLSHPSKQETAHPKPAAPIPQPKTL